MEVKYIAIHCSATKEGKDYHAADIDKWHRERGFKKIGYHYVITLDGIIEQGITAFPLVYAILVA